MTNPPNDDASVFSSLFYNSRVNAFLTMDTTGIITGVNPAFKFYFGYSDDDLLGKHFSMLFTDEDRARNKPDIELSNVLQYGQADDKNYLVHKDKRITWVSGESVLIKHEDGHQSLMKVLQDIEVQKESEISLTRANDFNESILNTIEDFVLVLNASMQIISSNPAFSRVTGKEGGERILDFASYIQPFDTQQQLLAQIKSVMQTGKPCRKHEIQIITPRGERVFEINCQALFTRGQEKAVSVIGHDITAQKRADTEREDLMGFVAHELRNPLASMMMSNEILQLMATEGKPEEMNVFLEKNKNNIRRLNKMVEELYDAAKVGGGHFNLNAAPFDFDEMVSEAVDTFRTLYPSFILTIEGKANAIVNGDRYRVLQVVSNYLGNAVKYAAGYQEIIIRLSVENNQLTCLVADRGAGIAPDQLPYLFDRFFRVDKTRNMEGIGLGLYLCRRIIQAHGGDVWAESEINNGSMFYFTLPVMPQIPV